MVGGLLVDLMVWLFGHFAMCYANQGLTFIAEHRQLGLTLVIIKEQLSKQKFPKWASYKKARLAALQ